MAADSQDLCFTAQSERNPAFEKGYLFSRSQRTSGCGSGLLTTGAAVLATALSSGCQWCFLNAVQSQGSVKSLSTNHYCEKAARADTQFCEIYKQMKVFWGCRTTSKIMCSPGKLNPVLLTIGQ